jgi:aminomethyltransferase
MRTPLFDTHMRLHARIFDFHGWEMPVWYTGIIEEHLATRNAAGLFDVSHMGEILVSGKLSTAYLDRVLAIDISALPEGKVKYALLLNQAAGIIDDLLVYCLEPGARYMLCVNAANIGKDYAWLVSQNAEGVELADKSNQTAMLALQGPDAG